MLKLPLIKWFLNKGKGKRPLKIGDYLTRLLALLFTFFILYQLWVVLHIVWWLKFNPMSSAFMDSRLAAMREKNPEAQVQFHWVNYQSISTPLKRAVIASEDAKFMMHSGFDWEGIQTAFEKNMKKGKVVAGGSTISQQLAKNLFLSAKRTPWRKLEEALITVMLEAILSKERIFEIYLNVIEWGNGVFGAEAAAKHYFKHSANQINRYQAAKLAAMIPNPRYYDNHRQARRLNHKKSIILRRMYQSRIP